MYTIKEAAGRTGIPIELLRAWERRYGIVEPRRTASGYRLYDDEAIGRLRSMRTLVDSGWTPSAAATAILSGEAPVAVLSPEPDAVAPTAAAPNDMLGATFVEAAVRLDAEAVEASLDRMFAAGTFETVVDELLLPALVSLGEAWASGRLSVAGEHAASHAVLRRLAAAFQAAGRAPSPTGAVLVGLPPGSRHELGALAFAVAARRAGLPVVYVGADLPVSEWVVAVERAEAIAAVIASPTPADVDAAIDVADAIAAVRPLLVIAFGGRAAGTVVSRIRGKRGLSAAFDLPNGIAAAVDDLVSRIRSGRSPID